MEELFAYAYLLEMDLISEEMYEDKLNELFLENPTDEDLLELEFLNRKRKETVRYIRTHINYNDMDIDKFGKVLFELLKPIYESIDIHRFGNAMYSLWESLPGNLQDVVQRVGHTDADHVHVVEQYDGFGPFVAWCSGFTDDDAVFFVAFI